MNNIYSLEKSPLYSQRDKFILIGLTGRTGSGCTTVAKIMSKNNLQDLDLRSYKNSQLYHKVA